MAKFKLLLLDANVVIYLFELGLWENVIDRCDIHLARSVVEESKFWEDENDNRHYIDWCKYDNKFEIFDETPSELVKFLNSFDVSYAEKLDDGENEALTHLFRTTSEEDDEVKISSGDAIVFRVLGNQGRSHQGISLEEVFVKVGIRRKLKYQYSKKFREKYSGQGMQESLSGYGKK